jgi:hypothetical protein
LFESLQISQVSPWVDKSTTNSVGVTGNGSNDADARILRPLHIVEKKIHKKEVSEVVDTLERDEKEGEFGRFLLKTSKFRSKLTIDISKPSSVQAGSGSVGLYTAALQMRWSRGRAALNALRLATKSLTLCRFPSSSFMTTYDPSGIPISLAAAAPKKMSEHSSLSNKHQHKVS